MPHYKAKLIQAINNIYRHEMCQNILKHTISTRYIKDMSSIHTTYLSVIELPVSSNIIHRLKHS